MSSAQFKKRKTKKRALERRALERRARANETMMMEVEEEEEPETMQATSVSMEVLMQRVQHQHPALFTDVIDADSSITLISPTIQYHYAWEVTQFVYSEYGDLLSASGRDDGISQLLKRIASDLSKSSSGHTSGIRRDLESYCVEYIVLLLVGMARGDALYDAAPPMQQQQQQQGKQSSSNDILSRLVPHRPLNIEEMQCLLQALLAACRIRRGNFIPVSVCSFFELYTSFMIILQTCTEALDLNEGVPSKDMDNLVQLVGEACAELFGINPNDSEMLRMQEFDRNIDVEAAIKSLHAIHDNVIRQIIHLMHRWQNMNNTVAENLVYSCITIQGAAFRILRNFVQASDGDCIYVLGTMHLSVSIAKLACTLGEFASLLGNDAFAKLVEECTQTWYDLLKQCYMGSNLVLRFLLGWKYRTLYLRSIAPERQVKNQREGSKNEDGSEKPGQEQLSTPTAILGNRFLMEMIVDRKSLGDIYDMLFYLLQSDYSEMVIHLLRVIGDAFITQCDRHLEQGSASSISERDVGKARSDFFLQVVDLVKLGFRRGLVSNSLYLRMASNIFGLMHQYHSYLPGSTKSLSYIAFDNFAQESMQRLLLLVDKDGNIADKQHAQMMFDLLTRLVVLESRVVIPQLPSLWFVLFKMDHSQVIASTLERSIGTLLNAIFGTIVSSHMHEKPFSAYFKGLHMFCNHCLVYFPGTDWDLRGKSILYLKPLREAMKSFIHAIPSAQLVSCMEHLAKSVKKYAKTLHRSSNTEEMQKVVSNLVPLILFPLSSFGFHVVIYESCYTGLHNASMEEGMPLVRMLFKKFISKSHDDQLVASVLQLYYAMRNVHNRAEEFSSDVYLLKPLPSAASTEVGKRKRRKLAEDLLLDFGSGEGKTLDELISERIADSRSEDQLSSSCMLYYVIMQRMFELNQQLMIQRHSLIYINSQLGDGTSSTQFKLQLGYYNGYFEFIMAEFNRHVSKVQGITDLADMAWDGLVESVTKKQHIMIMLWKLITANFSHILPNLEDSSLETIIGFAITHATPQQLARACEVQKYEGDVNFEGSDTIESITGRFIQDEQILDLERARPFVLHAIFSSLKQSIEQLVSTGRDRSKLSGLAEQLLKSCDECLSQKMKVEQLHVILERLIASALDLLNSGKLHGRGEDLSDFISNDQIHMALLSHLPTTYFDARDAYVFFCAVQLLDVVCLLNCASPQTPEKHVLIKTVLHRLSSAMGEKRKLFTGSNMLMLHMMQHDAVSTGMATVDGRDSESELLETTLSIHNDILSALDHSKNDSTIQTLIVDMAQVLFNEQENAIRRSTAMASLNMLYGTLGDYIAAQKKKDVDILPLTSLFASETDNKGTTLFTEEMRYIAQRLQKLELGFAVHLTELLFLFCTISREFKDVSVLTPDGFNTSVVEDMILAMLDQVAAGFLHQLPRLQIDSSDHYTWRQICRMMSRLSNITSIGMDIVDTSPFTYALAERLHAVYRGIAETCIHYSALFQNAEFSADAWRRQLAEIYRRIVSKRSLNRQRFFTISHLLRRIHESIASANIDLAWVKRTMLSDDDRNVVTLEGCKKVEDQLLKTILPVSSLVSALLKFCEARPLLLMRAFFDTLVMRLYEAAQPFIQLLSVVNSLNADNASIRRLTFELCVLLEKIVHTGEVALYTLRTDAARYTNFRLLGTICATIAPVMASIKSNSYALSKLVITICNLIRTNAKLGFYLSFNTPQVVPALGHLVDVLFNIILMAEIDENGNSENRSTASVHTESWSSVGSIAPLFVIETVAVLYMTIGLNSSFAQQLDVMALDLLRALDSGNNGGGGGGSGDKRTDLHGQQFYMLKRQSLDIMFDKGLARFFKRITPDIRGHIFDKLEQAGEASKFQLMRHCVDRSTEVNRGLRVKRYEQIN